MGNRGSSWRIVRVFEDRGVSGAKAERSGLDEALAYLCDGDTGVVWKGTVLNFVLWHGNPAMRRPTHEHRQDPIRQADGRPPAR